MFNTETVEALTYPPERHQVDYTRFYHHSESDSPNESRKQLIGKLIAEITAQLQKGKKIVRILDLGAGRQILEKELQKNSAFASIADKVQIITLDIATLSRDPKNETHLLADNIDHVEADGAKLPFGAKCFDVVYSSMAIDFMPLGQAAAEVNRVLTSDGTVLINFHHPDLYPMGVRKLADIKKRISRSTVHIMRREKLARLFDIGSENAPKKRPREEKTQRLRDKLDVLKLEFVDINFVVFYFPHIVFQSAEHIENFITTEFPNTFFQVSEQKNPRLENSWYQAEIRRENTKL